MKNLTELKENLMEFYSECVVARYHKIKNVAEENYRDKGISRRKCYKAFELGRKLFIQRKGRTMKYLYLNKEYNK
jgi:hypothetical protein